MGKKVVLDTNIFISALGWEGNSKIIFNKIIDKEYELIISNKQLIEIKRVLDYPKFKFTDQQRIKFLKILYEISKIIKTKIKINIIKEDPSDNILLETALEGQAEFIITGDNHLLKLKMSEISNKLKNNGKFLSMLKNHEVIFDRFKDISIISPKEFLKCSHN